MNKTDAQLLVLRSQLSHARWGLAAAANNTVLAGEWLGVIRGLEKQVNKLEGEVAEQDAAGAEAEAA